MNWKISGKQYRLHLISAIILLVGLGSAIVIYITAADGSDSVLGYDIAGGTLYPDVPSKMDVHNVELYGGKPLVLWNDILRWFDGLWYGKSLAITIIWITLIAAGVNFFFNNYVSFENETENKR